MVSKKELEVTPYFLLVFIILFFLIIPINLDEIYDVGVLVQNLDTPWAIDFLPDGSMIFTEREGKVSVFDGTETVEVLKLDIEENSEAGLLGIAVDPDFEINNFVYIYYSDDDFNKVSRFALGERMVDEFVVLDGIPSGRFHDGGRLKFGTDGYLYATAGDSGKPLLAQDTSSLAGKILRINKDGSIPPDNPFGNAVYSYGHRNPQGLAWDGNILYSSEHGSSKNDEINIIVKGGNYGWPHVECDNSGEGVINPIRCYSETTIAPSGIAFYEDQLFIAGLRSTQVIKLNIKNGRIVGEDKVFENFGRMRDIVFKNNKLYISSSNKDGRGFPKIGDDKIREVYLLTDQNFRIK